MNWIGSASQGMQLFASVILALYALSSSLSLLLGFMSTWFPALKPVAALCSTIGVELHDFGARLSNWALPASKPRGFVTMRNLWHLVLTGYILSVIGCTLLTHVAPPAATLVACVVPKAIKGETVAQIATECSADVAAVIQAIATSDDPAVKSSPAAAEVAKVKAALR